MMRWIFLRWYGDSRQMKFCIGPMGALECSSIGPNGLARDLCLFPNVSRGLDAVEKLTCLRLLDPLFGYRVYAGAFLPMTWHHCNWLWLSESYSDCFRSLLQFNSRSVMLWLFWNCYSLTLSVALLDFLRWLVWFFWAGRSLSPNQISASILISISISASTSIAIYLLLVASIYTCLLLLKSI